MTKLGIQKDAGDLLILLYTKYTSTTSNEKLYKKQILQKIEWESGKFDRALKYLESEDMIEIFYGKHPPESATHYTEPIISQIKPKGIRIIENGKEFEKSFNFKINLGLVQSEWGTKTK